MLTLGQKGALTTTLERLSRNAHSIGVLPTEVVIPIHQILKVKIESISESSQDKAGGEKIYGAVNAF